MGRPDQLSTALEFHALSLAGIRISVYLGLRCLGKIDYEAVNTRRDDAYVKDS